MATPMPQGETTPQAQAQLNGIVAHDEQKNAVPVHTFDPNAPPEEKAAAAGKSKDKLQSVTDDGDAGAGGKGVIHRLLTARNGC